jgi:hypothetical protein
MKNKLTLVLFTALIFIFTLSLFPIDQVSATVGGPTYIHTFKYNPKDESVYFIQNDMGGRGCPPVLFKISLATGKEQAAFSCDQGEALREKNNFDESVVTTEINNIIANFKDLTPIHLKNNKISIDVNFVKSETYDDPYSDAQWIQSSTFNAAVYQDDKNIAELAIQGCNKDQPFTFAGYAVPGFEKKIVLLLSTKGDCFEGGYIDETLYVVGGIENLNKFYSTNTYKGPSALTPSEETLVVFEADTVRNTVNNATSTNETIDDTIKKDYSTITIITIAIAAIIAGVFLGRMTKKIQS